MASVALQGWPVGAPAPVVHVSRVRGEGKLVVGVGRKTTRRRPLVVACTGYRMPVAA